MAEVRVPKTMRVRDPNLLAPAIGLEVLTDDQPGIVRVRCGRGFRFVDPDGATVRDPERNRLVSLAVPPAWEDVWLCPSSLGYLQATGRDALSRKQYRYHDEYRQLRESQKFARLRYFARALPQLRQATEVWIEGDPGTPDFAVGGALRLIDIGLVRVGNEQSASNGHRGATTLHPDHLEFDDDEDYVVLQYTAKGGKQRSVVIEDEKTVDAFLALADAEAERLFWYVDDDGEERRVTSELINRTIAELVGSAFTAKDFRTWGGSRAAFRARVEGANELEAIDSAAERLGNTRAVARSAYVHPSVLAASSEEIQASWSRSRSSKWLTRADSALAKLLAESKWTAQVQ